MTFDQLAVDFALAQLGAPYIWAGRGDWYVSEGKILSTTNLGDPKVRLVFDCAGLVLWAAFRAGADSDGRGWWGADTLWTHLPERLPDEPADANRLVFYGSPARASHVALDLGRGIVLEAAGGDSRTTSLEAAAKGVGYGPARVRVGREHRLDRLGYRSLLALKTLPSRPPTPKG